MAWKWLQEAAWRVIWLKFSWLLLQTTTGELLLGRCPRSRLDLLKPHTAEWVEKKQSQQKEQHDLRSRERPLEVGTNVFVRNYHHGNHWLPGVIEQKTGPISFKVGLEGGRIRRHQDQVRNRSVEMSQESTLRVFTSFLHFPLVTSDSQNLYKPSTCFAEATKLILQSTKLLHALQNSKHTLRSTSILHALQKTKLILRSSTNLLDALQNSKPTLQSSTSLVDSLRKTKRTLLTSTRSYTHCSSHNGRSALLQTFYTLYGSPNPLSDLLQASYTLCDCEKWLRTSSSLLHALR